MNSGTPGPKLDEVARAKVRAWIIAGLSNDAINGKLVDAGHKSLSPEMLSIYRRDPEVAQARKNAVAEIYDYGKVARQKRIKSLSDMADAALKKMGLTEGEEAELVERATKHGPITTALYPREYQGYVLTVINCYKEISRLVDIEDGANPTPEQSVIVQQGITQGQINDALELVINRLKAKRVEEDKSPVLDVQPEEDKGEQDV